MIDKPIQSPHHYQPSPPAFPRRLLAYVLDGMITAMIMMMILLVFIVSGNTDLFQITCFATVAYFLYDWILHGQFGATPGKYICGIEVQNNDGSSLSYLVAFLRSFVKIGFFLGVVPTLAFIPIVITILSTFLVIFSFTKRALHDRIAQTQPMEKRPLKFFEGFAFFSIGVFSLLIFVALAFSMFDNDIKQVQGTLHEQSLETTKKILHENPVNKNQETTKIQKKDFEKNNLESIQYIDQHMYEDALVALDAKNFDVDQDLVQSFGLLLVVPERIGMNKVKLHMYLPSIPNFHHYANSLQFRADPVYDNNRKKVNYIISKPEFALEKSASQEYLYGTSTFSYEGVPFKELRINLSLSLPTKIRKIEVFSQETKPDYFQYRERVFNVSFVENALTFDISGIYENYLGILAYDNKGAIIEAMDEYIQDKSTSVRTYDYNFASAPYRVEIFVNNNFHEVDVPAVINLEKTFIKARDHYITFVPQPKQYLKKSILNSHIVKTKRYDIKIEDQDLVINSIRFGKIKKKDWVHLEGKKVYINGKVLN